MEEYIAFDSHKHYTLMEREGIASERARQVRIEHSQGAIRRALGGCARGTSVAVEAVGNWYWIVEEIEAAGLTPKLVHPRKAKLMMGMINKTDKLDVHGLNRLQRNHTLPTVWVPPKALRDLRELTRCRLPLTHQRTQIKNRVLSILEKHALGVRGISDVFGRKGRQAIDQQARRLPRESRWVVETHLEQIDFLDRQIHEQATRVREMVRLTEEMERLKTMPGIGDILSASIVLEVGDVSRFPDAEHLASYAGTVPRVHASGGKVRFGRTRPDVNRYLKWAYAEAANSIVVNHLRRPERYVSRVYHAVHKRRGHARAVGAVARHLAEATYYVLTRKEPYHRD